MRGMFVRPSGTGATGPAGPTGATGATGPQGATGPAGTNGTNGTNGSNGHTPQVYSGSSAPSTLHTDGDLYLNTSTGDLYSQISGAWTSAGNIKGPQGNTGATGSTGAAGVQGIQGNPGATGPAGSTGATGAAGTNGTNGNTIWNGTGAPTTIGVAGDFYIDTAANKIYGPKTTTWPSTGTSMVGPQGSTGATGSVGPQGVQGNTGPTGATGSAGTNGQDASLTYNGTTKTLPKISIITTTTNSSGVWSVSLSGFTNIFSANAVATPSAATVAAAVACSVATVSTSTVSGVAYQYQAAVLGLLGVTAVGASVPITVTVIGN